MVRETLLKRFNVMKQVLIGILLFIAQQINGFTCEPRYVVTDFDDTIKTYGRDGHFFRIGNALFGRKINAGMNVLLDEIASECESAQGLTVLTASPKIIGSSIRRLLKKHQIKNYELIMRPLSEKTLEYKISRVNQIYQDKRKPLILVGDDTSKDPDAYFDFALKNPELHLATYIHNVRNRPPLEGQINYITSFEVALHEYNADRLTEDDAITVGLHVLASDKYGVIPRYGHCPRTYILPRVGNNDLEELSNQVRLKVESICKNRK